MPWEQPSIENLLRRACLFVVFCSFHYMNSLQLCKTLAQSRGQSWGLRINTWRTVVSGTWKYDEPKVENVTRGRSPSVTFSAEGRPISMSHERLCVIWVYIHFGPWSLRSSVTSVLGPKCTSISGFSQFRFRSFRSWGPKWLSQFGLLRSHYGPVML